MSTEKLREFWGCPTLAEAATKRITTDWSWPWDEARISATFDDVVGIDVGGKICVDYGCGIGRFSREALRRGAMQVIGIDISPDMLRLAVDYVGDEKRFLPILATEDGPSIGISKQADVAWSFLVLQHCWSMKSVSSVLHNMAMSLIHGGYFSAQFLRKFRQTEGECERFDGVAVSEGWVLEQLRETGVEASIVESLSLPSLPHTPDYDWWFAKGNKQQVR